MSRPADEPVSVALSPYLQAMSKLTGSPMQVLLSISLSSSSTSEAFVVNESHFGVNLLFDRDVDTRDSTGMSVSGTFARAADDLGATVFRYPGGTISETLFDLRNPDNPAQMMTWQEAVARAFDPDGAGPMEGVTLTLGGALDFACASNMSMTFVMPTYCFLSRQTDGDGHRWANVDRVLVREFVTRLLDEAGDRGVALQVIEIGNEWYVDNSAIFGTRMTPVEYGRIASSLAATIHEAVEAWKAANQVPTSWQEPSIIVQVGPGGAAEYFTSSGHYRPEGYSGPTSAATDLIFSEFDAISERAAIDGLVSHRYLTGSLENVTGWSYRPFERFDHLSRQVGGFGELSRNVTEWNVSAGNETVLSQWHGAALVALLAEMVAAGVDQANVWALQQNNSSRLTNNAGFYGEEFAGLSIGGEVFRLMASALPGLAYVPTSDNSASIQTHVFSSENHTVTYLSNVSDESVIVSFDAGQVFSGLSCAWVTVVGRAEGNGPMRPDVTILTGRWLWAGDRIELNLAPGDVAQVELVSERGATITGYTGRDKIEGSSERDILNGEAGRDHLWGRAKADVANGGTGNDRIYGGAGYDTLFAGSGDDTVFGGNGDDGLWGGAGDDVLFGATGDDSLCGGTGSDFVSGGEGRNHLYGGSESDTFILVDDPAHNIICDFEVGVDRIDVRAWARGPDVLQQTQLERRGTDVWIEGTEGRILIVRDALVADVLSAMIWAY